MKNEPILKIHWERFKAHVTLDKTLLSTLIASYTNDPIETFSLLSEGCANTNYKITFKNERPPIVFRIYVREKSALLREMAIHRCVQNQLPVPKYLYANPDCTTYDYPYALIEWIEGQLMREVVLKKDEKAISECLFDAGRYLNILRKMKLPQGGFFMDDLSIRPFDEKESYLPFVFILLDESSVRDSLGMELHQAIVNLIMKNKGLLPSENDANLTHGDYDPANLLVKAVQGEWKIVGILDWEFSFAGSYLLDIGTMLRYSHKLPTYYEENFIKGIESNDSFLPKFWKKQAKLMDLLCLLNLLFYNPFSERPRLN